MRISIQKTQKVLRIFDWAVAVLTVLAGLFWFKSSWIIVMGILGLVLAYINPAQHLQKYLTSRLFVARGRAS